MSYLEFSYSLLQGYDFYHLNKTLNCTMELGGQDQWGNMPMIGLLGVDWGWGFDDPVNGKSQFHFVIGQQF